MKRVKFLALAMVVALMLMGAGYAYWTDNITLTQTVNMGEFDVTVNDGEVTLFEGNTSESREVATASIVVTGTSAYADNNDTYTVTIDNAYPGLEGTVSLKVHNVGSIPAIMESFSVTPNSNTAGDLLSDIDYKLIYNENGGSDSIIFGSATAYGGNNAALDTFLDDTANNPLYNVILQPMATPFAAGNTDGTENNGTDGEYVELKLPFRIDNINDEEGNSCTFTIDIGFAQFNAPVSATTLVP